MSVKKWPACTRSQSPHENWKIVVAAAAAALVFSVSSAATEQRNEVFYLRGPYNTAFFHRNNETFMNGAAIHVAHGYQHDILERTPISNRQRIDEEPNQRYIDFFLNHRAKRRRFQKSF